jgi:hypothetical protein
MVPYIEPEYSELPAKAKAKEVGPAKAKKEKVFGRYPWQFLVPA